MQFIDNKPSKNFIFLLKITNFFTTSENTEESILSLIIALLFGIVSFIWWISLIKKTYKQNKIHGWIVIISGLILSTFFGITIAYILKLIRDRSVIKSIKKKLWSVKSIYSRSNLDETEDKSKSKFPKELT